VATPNALTEQEWSAQVLKGQTVIPTAEAGGSVTFTFEQAYTPAWLTATDDEALELGNNPANAENPRPWTSPATSGSTRPFTRLSYDSLPAFPSAAYPSAQSAPRDAAVDR